MASAKWNPPQVIFTWVFVVTFSCGFAMGFFHLKETENAIFYLHVSSNFIYALQNRQSYKWGLLLVNIHVSKISFCPQKATEECFILFRNICLCNSIDIRIQIWYFLNSCLLLELSLNVPELIMISWIKLNMFYYINVQSDHKGFKLVRIVWRLSINFKQVKEYLFILDIKFIL